MLVIPQDRNTLLTRDATAAALTESGYPTSPKTLATKASRGGGPSFRHFGPRVLYRRKSPKPHRRQHVRGGNRMTRHGPLNGSGPRSETSFRAVDQGSDTRSDAWRASLTPNSSQSLSKPTAPPTLMAGTALTVILRARGRSRFDALLDGVQIVKASKNPISDAARVLHRMGYSDRRLLFAQHEAAAHYAMRATLGSWRKLRIREDRGLRYVAWEPRPRRVGAKKGRSKRSTTVPGATYRHSAARHLSRGDRLADDRKRGAVDND
jgi:hypothetical protein